MAKEMTPEERKRREVEQRARNNAYVTNSHRLKNKPKPAKVSKGKICRFDVAGREVPLTEEEVEKIRKDVQAHLDSLPSWEGED